MQDRRGQRAFRGGALGLGGTVVVVIVALFLGVDPSMLLNGIERSGIQSPARQTPASAPAADGSTADFVSVVLADTEDTWNSLFSSAGRDYQEPQLVLFSDAVQSRCGYASATVGPFYCPADQQIYLDLNFFDELSTRFGAPGDFAQAYVVAHEVGHHIQTLLGISQGVRRQQADMSRADANALSVRLELQADCLSGVWAHNADRARSILEAGDIEEGLNAASAIGDDRLQEQSQGHVVPDSFTHGSSEQRVRWFRRGLEAGSMAACDTFATDRL